MHFKKKIYSTIWLILIVPLFFFIQVLSSCQKYLEKKPRQDLVVPSTLTDLQAILDNEITNSSSPGDLEFVADNYYLTNSTWNSTDPLYRKSYIWDKDATVTRLEIWDAPYNAIYQANLVLDQLSKIQLTEFDINSYNNIKGTALLYRSFMFHQLAQLFCKPYSTSSATDLGIVLRLTSVVTSPSTRATVQRTYEQVLNDLKAAVALLPVTSLFVTRPNKAAAYGELARVYLSMRDYVNANKYADSCLNIHGTLLDYNSLTPSGQPVLPYFSSNPEMLFLSVESFAPILNRSHEELIDSSLYQSYNPNDLRKTVFFGSTSGTSPYYWRGSYSNAGGGTSADIYDGIATDEVYLIRAECNARAGNKDNAMSDLNVLLRKRWKTGTFTDLTATNNLDALNKILTERRKELIYRGTRWSDLRRLNLEGANITLTRVINGITYTLPPNDLRWVLLIPDKEINQSGISQNPR